MTTSRRRQRRLGGKSYKSLKSVDLFYSKDKTIAENM